jgi:hypothetical protein
MIFAGLADYYTGADTGFTNLAYVAYVTAQRTAALTGTTTKTPTFGGSTAGSILFAVKSQ